MHSDSLPLTMYKKRPVVWLDGEYDVPKLASVELKYKKINVLIALVCNISYYVSSFINYLFIYLFETRNISDGNRRLVKVT